MHMTASQQGVGIAVDIGTEVVVPSATTVKGVLVTTVTAAKYRLYLVGAFYKDIGLGNSSCITATIDSFNTDVASLDNDIRFLARSSRSIVSQVTATIDGSYFVGARTFFSSYFVCCWVTSNNCSCMTTG